MRQPVLFLLFCSTLFFPMVSGAELSVSFTDDSLIVTGVSPGTDVAMITVWRERFPGWSRTTRFADLLTDLDGDGNVERPVDRSLPESSLWIVADLTTGEWAVATPQAYPFPEIEVSARRLRQDLEVLEADRETLELMIVRPGEGAWHLTVWDGGTGDDDALADGRVAARLPAFESLGSAPIRIQSRPGDLVFGIEARRMEWFAAALGPATPSR